MGLAHRISSEEAEVRDSLEQRALERLARVLCSHTEQLAREACLRGALGTREAVLQAEVFAERYAQVMSLLETNAPEVDETRMARLERLIAGIEFSRTYFMNIQAPAACRGGAGFGNEAI
jgi:hypothetical protein